MLADVAGPVLIFIAFLGFWYWLSYHGMAERRRFLVPPLHEVIHDGYLDWRNFSVMLKPCGSRPRSRCGGLASRLCWE